MQTLIGLMSKNNDVALIPVNVETRDRLFILKSKVRKTYVDFLNELMDKYEKKGDC